MFEPNPFVEEMPRNQVDESVKWRRLDYQRKVNSMFAHDYWCVHPS